MSRKPYIAHQYIALLTFPDRSMVESITEVPDLQVAKMGKSSILCLFFLLSVVSQASMITVEAIIVIQMQNKKHHKSLDIALTTYCSSLNVKTP